MASTHAFDDMLMTLAQRHDSEFAFLETILDFLMRRSDFFKRPLDVRCCERFAFDVWPLTTLLCVDVISGSYDKAE